MFKIMEEAVKDVAEAIKAMESGLDTPTSTYDAIALIMHVAELEMEQKEYK